MRRIALLLTILLLGGSSVSGQTLDCSNIGFEEGTTRGWVLTNGSVTDINQQTVYQNEAAGTFENGHLITSLSHGNDPVVTTETIPMVAPGSTHSLRIGNTMHGARFDRIRGTFVVTPDNSLFQYRFAVVLQNPTHQPYQQPGFTIRITNTAGAVLACSDYDVTAANNIVGFKAQGDIRYRNWTTGAINLKPYIGQTVTVEVTARGCTERRHFGYAYFDAQCLKSEITSDKFCPGAEASSVEASGVEASGAGQLMTLRAPEGFATYAWNTGQTTQTIQIKPVQGAQYQVTVTPFASLNSACQFTLPFIVQVGKPVVPTKQTVSICAGDVYRVGDSTYRTTGTYLTPIRRGAQLCDSLVQTTLTVNPLATGTRQLTLCEGDSVRIGTTVYKTAGSFQTRLTRPAPRCDSIVTTQITVRPFRLTISTGMLIRPGSATVLQATVAPNDGTFRFTWSPADGLTCPTCATTIAQPSGTTQYTLLAEDTVWGCGGESTVLLSVGTCMLMMPNAFSPNGDGTNDVFYVPANACIRQIDELTIYDRWGEVIFDARQLPAGEPTLGWNGTYGGLEAESGMYTYKITVAWQSGPPSTARGRLMLTR